MIHRMIAMLALAVLSAGSAQAQGAFPAPLPGQQAAPLASIGAAPIAQACLKEFVPLREEAEKGGKLIKAASDRHAPPEEACKLIAGFSQAELKMIKYVEANTAKCGIPPQIADQLKTGHKSTEALHVKVCSIAEQMRKPGLSLSGVFGSSGDIGDPAMKPWRE